MSEHPSEKYYRDIARYYDPFTQLPDAQLYLTFAGRFGGSILELASGTGRITFILAEAGYELSGLLVGAAGFKIVEDYGGNDFSEYRPGDWKRVLVLKKN